jgi:uncharacterized protein
VSRSPGVYRREAVLPSSQPLSTAVPAFLGLTARGPVAVEAAITAWPLIVERLRGGTEPGEAGRDLLDQPPLDDWPEGVFVAAAPDRWPTLVSTLRMNSWSAFSARFGQPVAGGFLSEAVRGFFMNGGRFCYVLRLRELTLAALGAALRVLAHLDDVDLVCLPDAVGPRCSEKETEELQGAVLAHNDVQGRRMVLLDPRAGLDAAAVLSRGRQLESVNAALYYPWVRPRRADEDPGFVPPSGHVAGVFARSDERVGVHKAPANEALVDVLDVEASLGAADHAALNEAGVNVIRAFPGRGIRIWGARTLSSDPAWTYVPVRRVLLTAARWLETTFAEYPFEPGDAVLWTRIEMRLTGYLLDLYRRGALKGATPGEAFYVRCDAGLNPPSVREHGRVVAEVGLAPALPNEFVVVHIITDAGSVRITGPSPG